MPTTTEAETRTAYLDEINRAFAEAAKKRAKPQTFKTPDEWRYAGLAEFRKKVFPFLRSTVVKSVDELTEILCRVGVTGTREEAIQFVQKLYDVKQIDYRSNTLYFTQVWNRDQKEACRIQRNTFADSDDY